MDWRETAANGHSWLLDLTTAFTVCGALAVLASVLFPFLSSIMNRRPVGVECPPDEPFSGEATAKITSLRVYPIKSCVGHEVQVTTLGPRGFDFDRLWLVVDDRGRFMTQRRCPRMALISPSLPTTFDEPIYLSAPGTARIEIPVRRESVTLPPVEVQVWEDTCLAVDQGDEAALWLQNFLDMDGLRLVRMKDGFTRGTNPRFGPGFRTGFADGFPLLLTTEESLEELNDRMEGSDSLGMERFRPNIVVRGWGPFAEDDWTKIMVGNIPMRLPKPCSRCQIPTINQSTAERNVEPTETLHTFRSGVHLGLSKPSQAKQVFFGQNLLHEEQGTLRIGDVVKVLRVVKKHADTSRSGLKAQ